MDDEINTTFNGYERDDEYYCRMCDVTFTEPFPQYYDVVPCARCGWPSWNCCLDFREVSEIEREAQTTLSGWDSE